MFVIHVAWMKLVVKKTVDKPSHALLIDKTPLSVLVTGSAVA